MASRKDIAEQRRRLETYRANLQTLLDQKANVGGEPTATLPLVNLIGETRKEIKRIKKILRDWGEKIDDHPDDFQEFDDEPDAIDFLRRLIGWLRRNGLLVVIGLAIFGIAAFLISPVFSRPSQATAPTLTAMPLSPTVANPTITPAKQPTATLADPQTAEPTAVPSPTDTPSLEPTSTSTLTPTATSTATPTFTPKVPTHTTTRTPRPPTITPTTTPIPPPAACFRGTPEDLIKAEAEAALTKNQWIIHQIFKRDAAIEDRTRKIHRNDAWEYYREKYDDTTYSTAEHPTIQLVRAIGPEDTTAAYKSTSKGEIGRAHV